jgi:molybdenum cofactor synthesis domain-containing protein
MSEQEQKTAEILAIGNELLLGIVQDTNTHWLCKRITGLGGRVRRAALLPDDLEAIGDELLRALDRKLDLIVTTGGLGPTQDDRTLEAIARALGLPLEEHPEALKIVERRYRELYEQGRVDNPKLTESRRKMARLPQGTTPLDNHVGTAPGALIQHSKSTIVALPGVPSEMQDIWENALQPYLTRIFGKGFYLERTLVVEINDESRLAPILREFQAAWPQVYIKSRPKGFAEGLKILITLAMSGERPIVEQTIERLTKELTDRLKREGLPVTELEGGYG